MIDASVRATHQTFARLHRPLQPNGAEPKSKSDLLGLRRGRCFFLSVQNLHGEQTRYRERALREDAVEVQLG